MHRDRLIVSAAKLPLPSPAVADTYKEKMVLIVEKINRIMEKRSDLSDLIGTGNTALMKENHHNHARFIESIMRIFNPEALVDNLIWNLRIYRSRGFSENYWAIQLNAWLKILEEELDREYFTPVKELYTWIQINIPSFISCTEQ